MKNRTKTETLEEYLKFKSANVTTKGKLQEYKRQIHKFIESNKKPLKDFTESDLVNFLNEMNQTYNTRCMNDLKTLLKNFIVWYFPDYPQRFRNMSSLCRHLKIEPTYSSGDMLSKDEVEKLVKGEESIQWKTFWLTQFYGGMRPNETAKLKWQDVTFSDEGSFIEVYVKKNQKKFTKFLPENVSFYLKKLKETSTSELIFPSRIKREGKEMPMERNGIYRRLKKLSLRVLGKKVNPYLLRHSIATILYNEDGTDKDFVAQQMGHTRNMEKVYSHLDSEKIKAKLKKLYIKTEILPENKKLELEQRIIQLEKYLKEFMWMFPLPGNETSQLMKEHRLK